MVQSRSRQRSINTHLMLSSLSSTNFVMIRKLPDFKNNLEALNSNTKAIKLVSNNDQPISYIYDLTDYNKETRLQDNL
ncbi:hypothetical protein OSB04_001874 [Centaurea solstitialis]|uniref:Uncharacterized protein n=1 Tax=Centaurea solstitialis TaxID=347529 RepID=A0AA38TZD3_9ASTR|nr:hypothetical protein OSB04_001874 [Centaurea solstitialis]